MRLRARGQAVVELSLLMIVIIPVIFYTLFLDDLLRHRLDLLESVLSSPFDYGAIDQQKSKGADLTHTEQLTWCDHTSLYNAHNKGADCDNSVHHKAFTAHVCWLVGDAQQVTCTNDKSQGDIDSNASDYNGGGMVTCSAKAGVLNYFIAQQIFGGAFTKKDKSAKMTSAEERPAASAKGSLDKRPLSHLFLYALERRLSGTALFFLL